MSAMKIAAQNKLDFFHALVTLHTAHLQLQLGLSSRALKTVQSCLPMILVKKKNMPLKNRTSSPMRKKQPVHSALKLEKKCNFRCAKKQYLHFQKWQKINFCTRKKFKTTKNAIFGLKKITGFLKL